MLREVFGLKGRVFIEVLGGENKVEGGSKGEMMVEYGGGGALCMQHCSLTVCCHFSSSFFYSKINKNNTNINYNHSNTYMVNINCKILDFTTTCDRICVLRLYHDTPLCV